MTETLGRYEILEKIGQGGFAIVYRARDTELDRLVALKELKPILLQDTNWVKRFRREARAIARLDHPRIVPIYDVGQAEERLFIVMRLVDGPSLEELIGRQGRLPWPEALKIVTTLAEGLDHAHAQGILHRDLKPANILIDPERGPLLTDFGLAKLAGESSMSISATGSVVGSPPYIAPEVWEGQPASRQVDIYALGCILYELITGEKMFGGESAPAVMMAHFKPPVLPGRWPEGVPAGVEVVIKTALANKPADRYATAGEFAEALAALDQAETAQPMPSPVVAGPDPHQERPQPSPAKPADRADEPAEVEESPATTQSPAAAEKADWFSFGSEPQESDADNTWQGFLKHLGPYVIVIGFLAVINLLTSPDYLWFLWPAAGWGVGLAFHAQSVILSQATNLSDEWRDFAHHFGAYVIIIGLLIGIYLFTNPGGYPWFLWPAGGWGIAVALHLFNILFGESDHDPEKTARRAERRAERRAKRAAWAARKAEKRTAKPTARVQEGLAYSAMQPHLDKARAYKQQIDSLVKATADRNTQVRLQDLAGQVDEWTRAVEALARRVDNYQQNRLIHQDLETVPASIKTLETRLAQEKDAVTRAELERTLTSRKKQLAALQQLQNMMKRAELKIESTLSSLGTIYPQLLTSQSTNHVADYSRLSEEVDEEVRTLQDHLEALEEVKLGLGQN